MLANWYPFNLQRLLNNEVSCQTNNIFQFEEEFEENI